MKLSQALVLLPALVSAWPEFPGGLEPRQDNSALVTSCVNLAATCYPTIASCATSFCNAGCSALGPVAASCCAASTKAQCLAAVFATATATGSISSDGSSNPTITSAAQSNVISSAVRSAASGSLTLDQYYSGCGSFFSIFSSCTSRTPGFASLDATAQASCICYTSATLFPSVDGYINSCVTWASTAAPTDLPAIQSVTNFCANYAATTAVSSGSVTVAKPTASSGVGVASTIARPTSSSFSSSKAAAAAPQGNGDQQSIFGLIVLGLAALL